MTARDSPHENPSGRRRRSRTRIALAPLAPRHRTRIREAAGRRHGRRHVGRRAQRRRVGSCRSRRREHELVRRVREDDRLRLAHGGTECRQRHERRRRERAAAGSRDRPHLSLPRRGLERLGRDARRGRDAHDPGATRGRDQRRLGARAVGRDRRRVGGSERTDDRLVDRVRHEHALRIAHRHAVGRGRHGPGRCLRSPREAPGRGRVPLQARGVQRPRHRARRRPRLPHRSGAGGGDGRRRRRQRLVGARERDRRPARTRNGRVVRVRHEHEAGEPDAGPGGREPGEDLRAHRRPAARVRGSTSASSPEATRARPPARPAHSRRAPGRSRRRAPRRSRAPRSC